MLFKWSSRFNLESRTTPRCFWNIVWVTAPLLIKRRIVYLLCVSTKNYFLSLLTKVWIKTHFPLKIPGFNYWQIVIEFGPWGIASSANNSAFEERPFRILGNSCCNIYPRKEACPFNTTLFLRLYKKPGQISRKLPEKPFCSNLNMTSPCRTLSKAFEISRKTPLTS